MIHHTQLLGEDYAEQEFVAGASAFDFMTRSITSIPEPQVVAESAVKMQTRSTAAAGIAASWLDPEVYAARITRNGVRVTTVDTSIEFKCVREAFTHFRLPLSKHIRFRQIVKSDLEATFTHDGKVYLFTLLF